MKASSDNHSPQAPCLSYRLMQGMMWPMMKMTGLSCRHFAELSSTRLDRPLTRLETLRFRFHRMICTLCRPLPKQLEHLRELTRCVACDASHDDTPHAELDAESRARIRNALDQAARDARSQSSE